MTSEWSRQLGVSWTEVWIAVVAATGIYATVLVLTRLGGQRSLASFSTFDIAVSVAIGALVGRVVLVRTSLLAGVVGLVLLFALQAGTGLLRDHTSVGRRLLDNPPLLLVAHGEILRENLRRARLNELDVYEQLRRNGHTSLEEVYAVVLEPSGAVSVIAADVAAVDPGIFTRVLGREHLADVPRAGATGEDRPPAGS